MFKRERVDVAVVEVGIGGEFDATNVLDAPVVCAVTALGHDHQAILGQTLSEIAWHKAGVFKPGVPAWTITQRPDAAQVLVDRALERQVRV